MGIHPEKMKVIDPDDLCPEGIHDLLVHHLFPEKNESFFGKG